MAKNKTTETQSSVDAFVKKIADEKKRKDFSSLVEMIGAATKLEPKMWGTAIVGFGSYHYVYETGREGDAPLAGISPRASSIALYLGSEFENRDALIATLGKHKAEKGCIHIQKLSDVDANVLLKMVKLSIAQREKNHPA